VVVVAGGCVEVVRDGWVDVLRLGVVVVVGVDGVLVVCAGAVLVVGVVSGLVVVALVAVWPGVAVAGAVVWVGRVLVAVGKVPVAVGGTVVAGASGCAVVAGTVVAGSALGSSVSLTKANASIAPATAMIAPIATVGNCQFGVGASRVRAGAPHSRHQSCSGPRSAEQRGQRIVPGGGKRVGGLGGLESPRWALTIVPRRSSRDHAGSSGGSKRSVGCDV
jgi:hypothetical protein